MNDSQFIQLLESRLLDIFQSFQQGKDVPLATLFRVEGLLEAACFLHVLSQASASKMVSRVYTQVFNAQMPAIDTQIDSHTHTQTDPQRIYIPSQMKRAPVVPSTK